MKSLIKTLLRENINEIQQTQLTVDYFKKRIPFLKNPWHEVDYDRGIQIFTDQINHPEAKTLDSDKNIITFKKFTVGVNFEYTRGKVSGNDNVLHNFKMTPVVQVQLNSDDELFKSIFQRVMMMQLDKIGVNDSIELPKGADIPDAELDRIVNEMNKTFFVFEEFLANYGI